MSRGKNFNINVKPRDVLVDVKGLSADAGFAYLKFWMHHHLHGEPLPPREEQVEDFDEYFRDLLDMKNVRTWRKARDELVKKARLRVTEDGRLYIGRTMREVGKAETPEGSDSGGDSGGGQPRLPFTVVRNSGDEPGGRPGKVATSADVPPNIEQCSGEVRPNIGRSSADVARQPIDLKRNWVRPFRVFFPSIPFDSEVVAALMDPPRARGDPATLRA